MIHIMLGSCFDKTICNVLEYVLKYGDQELSDFFTGMTCSEGEDGSLIFTQAVKSISEGQNNTLYFNSDIDDEYLTSLSVNKVVIKPEKQLDYLKAYFVSLFDSRITINKESDDNTLNICLYLPLYDRKSWGLAQKLIGAISEQRRNIKVDLFFFAYDLAHLIVKEDELSTLPERLPDMHKESCRILKEAVEYKTSSNASARLQHIIVMQNCNSDGVSLDLNPDSFVRVIGEFAIASVNSYDDVFGRGVELTERPIVALGLSVLNLDKYYFVRYLLSKAYVKVLEREGVDCDLIDVSEPSLIVQELLTDNDCYKFYDKFYDARVRELIDQQLDEQTINTKATKALDDEVNRFVGKILSFINREDLSLSTKRVTLAQLLGLDDDLMTGDSSNPNQLVFRDSYSDCMNMFVEANNKLLSKGPSDIFVRIPNRNGKYIDMGVDDEGKEIQYPEEFANFATLSEEPLDFMSLQKSLKDTEVEIRRWTEYIRMRNKELKECEVTIKQSEEKNKVLVEGGFKYGNIVYKPVVVENIPLDLTYEPKTGSLPKSLDMRRNFSRIKSQGEVNSCTAFAVTSVYEYIMGLKGNKEQLSERFLYYNSRVFANRRLGNPEDQILDEGSSYFDALKSLGDVGISSNLLCQYGAGDIINEKPSDAAYEDAKARLVTEAKGVKIQEQDIKSALSDGYPVMVSVRLYESFASGSNGFIPLPTAKEIAEEKKLAEHSSHAMVICGYSDDDKVFIVRNSWGTAFGDNGYCYMPYSYILNPDLVPEACIITSVNSETITKATRGSQPTVQFDKLNPEINAAIIRNLVAEAEVVKEVWVQKWKSLTKVCTTLENTIVNASIRTSLYDGSTRRLDWEIDQIESQKKTNRKFESERIDELDHDFKKTIITYGISLLVIILAFGYLSRGAIYRLILTIIPLTKILMGLVAISIVAAIVYYFQYKKHRRLIQEEHRDINNKLSDKIHERENGPKNETGHLGLYKENLNVRMYLPWKVVIKLSEQGRLLVQKHQTLASFVTNLKDWHDMEQAKIRDMNPDTRDPFISLLSNQTLDAYFDENAERLTKDVRLYSLFQGGYEIKDDVIIRFRQKLKDTIVTALMADLKEFTVYKYLTGQTTFKFLGERKFDVDVMLTTLNRKSKVFLNLDDEAETFITESARNKALLSSDIKEDQDNWDARFQKNFSERFPHIPIASPYKITFIQLERVPVTRCIDLYNEEAMDENVPDNQMGKPIEETSQQEPAETISEEVIPDVAIAGKDEVTPSEVPCEETSTTEGISTEAITTPQDSEDNSADANDCEQSNVEHESPTE